MTVSPFDHPFLSGLLGDDEIARHFSAEADIAAMLAFEVALAQAEADEGLIPRAASGAIAVVARNFEPHIASLNRAVARDGVAVPEFVRQLRAKAGEPHAGHVHFGATSQDVIDTSLALRLRPALGVLASRLAMTIDTLAALSKRDGNVPVMAHTRMQAAIPVPASRKIASWREPLVRHQHRLARAREAVQVLTFGGAAGTLDKLGAKARPVTERMAAQLDLGLSAPTRHSERDGTAELASVLSLIAGSLGKMGADIALAAQFEVGEVRLASGGSSSSMPHKVNPVGAEMLVTLARFNATLLGGMHHALVHENERSGSAWTLEWMLLPQMMVAAGASLRTANGLIAQLSFVEQAKP